MIRKDKLMTSIADLPDEFSFDELLDRILLLQKIEVGLEQSKNGDTYTTEEAKAKLGKWFK